MKRNLLLALSLLLLLPVAAVAGSELTVFGGYRFDGDFDAIVNPGDIFGIELEVEQSATFGAALALDLGDTLALELSVSHQKTDLLRNGGVLIPDVELGDITLNYYLAGLQWQWGGGQLKPYFTLSAGVAELDPEAQGTDTETRLAAAAAFGLKIFATPHLGLRLEGRSLWADLDETERFDHGFGYADNDLVQFEATAGLILRF